MLPKFIHQRKLKIFAITVWAFMSQRIPFVKACSNLWGRMDDPNPSLSPWVYRPSRAAEETEALFYPTILEWNMTHTSWQMTFLLFPRHIQYLQRAKDPQMPLLARYPSSVWALRNSTGACNRHSENKEIQEDSTPTRGNWKSKYDTFSLAPLPNFD